MSSIRRVYSYLVSLISLGIMAAGLRILLSLLFNLAFGGSSSIRQPDFVQQQLSLGIAMLVIGGPLWFFFWRNIQKYAEHKQAEIGSIIRKVVLNLILAITSLMSLFAAEDVLNWLMAGVPGYHHAGGSLATLIVTAAIWFYHWRVSEGEGHPLPAASTLRRWYIYLASGWGLVQMAIGVIQLVHAGSLSLPVWGESLIPVSFWTAGVRSSISWIILGGLFWIFHWFRMARGDFDSILRQVYIYLLAIIGSSITGLAALVMGLYYSFVWVLGSADSNSGYFQFLGWVIPAVVVAAAIWAYHQTLAEEEATRQQERRLSSKRVHLYIMSFLGLGTMIAGLIILLGVLLGLLINGISAPVVIQPDWWQKQISLFLALLIAAIPIWWLYWNQVIKLSARGGVTEWRARSRRIYLYVIIGAAIITLAADLVNIFYQLLSAGLAGSIGINVLKNSKWSVQSLIVAAPLLIYHWQIARTDQRRGSEITAERKTVTVLASEQSQPIITRLEEKLGNGVHILQYIGPETVLPALTEEELAELVNNINSTPADRVMLVIYEGRFLVMPYEEKN
jgi:hypothetical protein